MARLLLLLDALELEHPQFSAAHFVGESGPARPTRRDLERISHDVDVLLLAERHGMRSSELQHHALVAGHFAIYGPWRPFVVARELERRAGLKQASCDLERDVVLGGDVDLQLV